MQAIGSGEHLRKFISLAYLCLAGLGSAATARGGLDEYVKRPEPAFTWKLNKTTNQAGTVYDIHMVSQVWQDIKWEHQLQVYQPKGTAFASTMLLWNTGGSASPRNIGLAIELARKIKTPVAFLYHIPNQPLFGGKKEDTLIAETFVRYLDTQDESWPLLFPMVKSVVKAMDVLQALGEKEWKTKIESFVITGASKRGWTSWLTAAADPRVKAFAPLVIDTLNMKKQSEHQLEAYGAYSEQIADYTSRGLVPMPDTALAKKLWSMVDPYFYRARLKMPKCIINGANDPYWTVDSLNLYWDGIEGDKWLIYVPNAGHNLVQKHDDGKQDALRAVNTLAAFARHQILNQPLPRVKWTHSGENGKALLSITAAPAPKGGRLWVVRNKTQDFRKARWVSQPVSLKEGEAVGEVTAPAEGFLAFFGEVDYEMDGNNYHFSTQVRVLGPSKASAR